MPIPTYPFLTQAARIVNSGQARVVMLCGNVNDLFHHQGAYITLPELLANAWAVPGRIVVTYEINGPIRFAKPQDRRELKDAFLAWRTGLDGNDLAIQRMLAMDDKRTQAHLDAAARSFDEELALANGRPTAALELLRQFCLCARAEKNGRRLLGRDLVVIIEAADLILPDGEIGRMSDADRARLHICHDWFSDPGFMQGRDCVVLIAESRSLIHQRIAMLPQVLAVPVEDPDQSQRAAFIDWYLEDCEKRTSRPPPELDRVWLGRVTAGLNIQALRQLLSGAQHLGKLTIADVVAKVEEHIQSRLGEGVVSFSRPEHHLTDVVGFAALKRFLADEFIPRCKNGGSAAPSGAAVAGPIGAGKTFIFEAVASELDAPVLVLRNIRSQWFGGTDVIVDRLRRVLESLDRAVIVVDEADTMFGGVGGDTHETERRLTGKIQAMMSDPRMRGKVLWILMTARIHLLSPDLRRPGRVGDLIIPILDPHDAPDREAFVRWMLAPALGKEIAIEVVQRFLALTEKLSAAGYAAIRSELKARSAIKPVSPDDAAAALADRLEPDISATRRYQALQALVNCTRKSLLPDPQVTEEQRSQWFAEIRQMEARGIR